MKGDVAWIAEVLKVVVDGFKYQADSDILKWRSRLKGRGLKMEVMGAKVYVAWKRMRMAPVNTFNSKNSIKCPEIYYNIRPISDNIVLISIVLISHIQQSLHKISKFLPEWHTSACRSRDEPRAVGVCLSRTSGTIIRAAQNIYITIYQYAVLIRPQRTYGMIYGQCCEVPVQGNTDF